MKAYNYNVASGNFAEWMSVHPDCETLLLKGELIVENGAILAEYDKVLRASKIKVLDIAELRIQWKDPDNNENVRLEQLLVESIYLFADEHSILPENLLVKIYLNRRYDSMFVFEDGYIITRDKLTLVDIEKTENIQIPSTVTNLGTFSCMRNNQLREIDIPEGIEEIGICAFAFCENLTRVHLPDSLTQLGMNAFEACEIAELNIPPKVSVISEMCFGYNELDLSQLQIPSTIKRIDDYGFYCNDSAAHVNIPEGVEYIGRCAMSGIESIHLPSTLRFIDPDFYQDMYCMCGVKYPNVDLSASNPYYRLSKRRYLVRKNDTLEFRQMSAKEARESWINIPMKWGDDTCVAIYLNGEEITDVIRKEEERYEKFRGWVPESSYVHQNAICLYGYLEEAFEECSDAISAEAELLCCGGCGCPGCEPSSVSITKDGEHVYWDHFSFHYGEQAYHLYYQFDRKQYEEQLKILKSFCNNNN